VIAWLKGKVLRKTFSDVVLDVHGVGYRLFITLATYENLPSEGGEVALEVVTVAREDALHLYGFHNADEKEMFLKLVSVTRVGPKLACQALSGITAGRMRNAIRSADADILSRAPGIGKKTAERIVMELKDKLGPPLETAVTPADDAVAALENLGYKRALAFKAVEKTVRKNPSIDLGELIRESLKLLAG